MTTIVRVFTRCVHSIQEGCLIRRESRQDKEFHFQDWFRARLGNTRLHFEIGGRNSYPDFRMVSTIEGYEVKGLAYPGREVNYDCNSQAPSGSHNGRTIYYVFGRYPATPDGDAYPVLDLVICHGSFLNADHEYIHKNKSIKGFGSYGDIMIRDRKMYVAPTPFGLTTGASHQQTLILPNDISPGSEFRQVGTLIRRETENLIVGYTFNLRTNALTSKTIRNPAAGREHMFHAWRLKGSPAKPVAMREGPVELDEDTDERDAEESE